MMVEWWMGFQPFLLKKRRFKDENQINILDFSRCLIQFYLWPTHPFEQKKNALLQDLELIQFFSTANEMSTLEFITWPFLSTHAPHDLRPFKGNCDFTWVLWMQSPSENKQTHTQNSESIVIKIKSMCIFVKWNNILYIITIRQTHYGNNNAGNKNTLECSLGWLSFISWFYHGKPVYGTFRYRATKGSLSYHVPFLSKLWARPQRHSHVCSCGHLPGNGGNFYNVLFDVNGDRQTWQRKIWWLLFGRHRCLLAVAWTLLLSNICQRRSPVSRLFDSWIYMECMKHQQTLILVLGK